MKKPSNYQTLAIIGFIGMIVSVFLTYYSPERGDSLSLYSIFANEDRYDAQIWIFVFLALAAVGVFFAYAAKLAGALFVAGLAFGFLGTCFILHSEIFEGSGSIGVGGYVGLVAAAVAILGASRTSEAR